MAVASLGLSSRLPLSAVSASPALFGVAWEATRRSITYHESTGKRVHQSPRQTMDREKESDRGIMVGWNEMAKKVKENGKLDG